jgi:hypothetical protein
VQGIEVIDLLFIDQYAVLVEKLHVKDFPAIHAGTFVA